MSKSLSNRLAHETSPYLLQHANNPVDWFPWGDEALEKAKQENKPILVSIGYSACHWCHVMEKESFEDQETADVMNKHFVNVKIDREERPDLDHIYMDAVQVMTGAGGWPLNVFLTPDGKPFYGGTYFPPSPAFNRPSWRDVLEGVSVAFQEKPDEILSQANHLTDHLIKTSSSGLNNREENLMLTEDQLQVIYTNIMKAADKTEGGFGKAPKFPHTFTIQNLLNHYYQTNNADALNQACLSLDKMVLGGIYDQVGGGFARYSTDDKWLAPHFEKMLYDNALLLMALSDAWMITHKALYKNAIEQTIAFIQREMLSPENGFYAAIDADSEGEEGKFYVWDYNEILSLLPEAAELFCEFYDVTENGNWENRNILNVPVPMEEFAAGKKMNANEVSSILQTSLRILLERRNKRIRPMLDDKILLGWNALMNTALCKAYGALTDNSYRQLAITNMEFIWEKFLNQETGDFFHTYKHKAKYPAFLDDYAYLIHALIHLQEITGNSEYLVKAERLTLKVIELFGDEEGGMFYYTNKHQNDVVIRKKEIYDGAVPSGNSIMAWNLLYLERVFDRPEWKTIVVKMLNAISDATVQYPTSFGVWVEVIYQWVNGLRELVVIGKGFEGLLKEILHIFMPNRILQASPFQNEDFPLLKGKNISEKPLIFLCENYACQAPVSDVKSLMDQLKNLNVNTNYTINRV